MQDDLARPPTHARTVLIVLGGIAGAGVLLCVGAALLLDHWFPSNEDFLIRNDTGAEITDVVLLRGHGGPDDDEVARIPRIGAKASALAEDAGTGSFSLQFSDSRGRWVAWRARWRDVDDIRMNDEPEPLVVSDGRVNDVPVKPLR